MLKKLREFSEAERLDMNVKRAAGWSQREIAAEFGCSQQSVSYATMFTICPVNHQELARAKSAAISAAKRNANRAELREKARQLRATGLGYLAIGKIIGLPYTTVHGYAHDVPMRKLRGSNRSQVTVVKTPVWVPDWLKREFRAVAQRAGEEAAASHCRRLKREAELAIAENPSLVASL